MPFTTRVWSAGKLLLLVGALAATYALFAVAAMRIALRTSEVTIPELKGRTVSEATTILADLGLTLKVDESPRPDATIGSGRITSQEPPAGLTARRRRSVKVWLSSGARASMIPRLVGDTERTAQLRLEQDGLGLAVLSEIRSDEYPAGTVIAQEPPPQSRGAAVALLVNRGERSRGYVMPDLIGVNGDRAAELLRAGGFRVAVVGEQPYPGVPAGVVLRQSPPAGFQIAPGEPISLEVSR